MTLDALRDSIGDRYILEREIGAGGMAAVYAAHDVRHDRKVALKVLRSDLAESVSAERFSREIRLAARLSHPNILPLFDSGEAPDGGHGRVLFYVMPLVEGQTLRERLAESGRLGVDEAVAIAGGVASALDYAHRNGVVHRDIKPDNILLQAGHALVADFGIGKALSSSANSSMVTQVGVSVGTPAYMSPEQAAGDETLDGRSDLYSLGCTIFEMLTGDVPFRGSTVQAVIAQRFTSTAPTTVGVRPEVPMHLSRAVAKLLARDPADRFQTGTDFIEATRPGQPAQTSPHVPGGKSIAVLPFANMSADSENEYFSDGMTEEIINALVQLPELRVAARTSVFAFKGKTDDLRIVAERLGVDTVLEGSVRKAGNRIRITAQLINAADGYHLWSERFDRELDDIFAVQDDIARAIAGKLKARMTPGVLTAARPHDVGAYDLYLQGRHFWAKRGPGLFKALECFNGALAVDPDYALAHAGTADVYTLLAFYGFRPPLEAIPRAREAALRALAIEPDLAEAHTTLGFVAQIGDRDFIAAEESLRHAIALKPTYLPARYWLATALAGQGRQEESVRIDEEALSIEPFSLFANVHLAWMLALAERTNDAVGRLEHTLALDPDFLMTHWLLGQLLVTGDRGEEGVHHLKVAADRSARSTWMLGTLGVGLTITGHVDQARAILRELVERRNTEYVSALAIASLHANLGDEEEAFRWLDEARRERDTNLAFSGIRNDTMIGMGVRPSVITDRSRLSRFITELGINPAPNGNAGAA